VFFVIAVTGIWCKCLGLLPPKGKWGQVSWLQFKEVFAFGRDIFLFALGSQLINGSQALLLTRFFGLETTAVWSVCTRTYTVLLQVIYRIFDYSTSALAEMIVRNEMSLLAARFRQIASLSASLSVAAGTLFALCNNSFIEVWTTGKIAWSPRNDLLLAAWLVVCISVHAHIGLVGQSKRFGFLRYIFFIEGLTFVVLAVLLHRFGGMTGMLLTSLVCALAFSFPYGLRRTRDYFNLSWGDLAEWHRAPTLLAFWLLPLAIATAWLTADASPLNRLVARAILTGLPASWMLLRFGLGTPLQAEVARRAPLWMRSLLLRCWCLPPGQ
jgi:O-antigen/teichoic acid export membrane protein